MAIKKAKFLVSWDENSLKPLNDENEVDGDEVEVTMLSEDSVANGAAEAGEKWCEINWNDSVHGETECFVRDETGMVHKVFVSVDFDPVFHGRLGSACNRCPDTDGWDPVQKLKDGTRVRCLLCRGAKRCKAKHHTH